MDWMYRDWKKVKIQRQEDDGLRKRGLPIDEYGVQLNELTPLHLPPVTGLDYLIRVRMEAEACQQVVIAPNREELILQKPVKEVPLELDIRAKYFKSSSFSTCATAVDDGDVSYLPSVEFSSSDMNISDNVESTTENHAVKLNSVIKDHLPCAPWKKEFVYRFTSMRDKLDTYFATIAEMKETQGSTIHNTTENKKQKLWLPPNYDDKNWKRFCYGYEHMNNSAHDCAGDASSKKSKPNNTNTVSTDSNSMNTISKDGETNTHSQQQKQQPSWMKKIPIGGYEPTLDILGMLSQQMKLSLIKHHTHWLYSSSNKFYTPRTSNWIFCLLLTLTPLQTAEGCSILRQFLKTCKQLRHDLVSSLIKSDQHSTLVSETPHQKKSSTVSLKLSVLNIFIVIVTDSFGQKDLGDLVVDSKVNEHYGKCVDCDALVWV